MLIHNHHPWLLTYFLELTSLFQNSFSQHSLCNYSTLFFCTEPVKTCYIAHFISCCTIAVSLSENINPQQSGCFWIQLLEQCLTREDARMVFVEGSRKEGILRADSVQGSEKDVQEPHTHTWPTLSPWSNQVDAASGLRRKRWEVVRKRQVKSKGAERCKKWPPPIVTRPSQPEAASSGTCIHESAP